MYLIYNIILKRKLNFDEFINDIKEKFKIWRLGDFIIIGKILVVKIFVVLIFCIG